MQMTQFYTVKQTKKTQTLDYLNCKLVFILSQTESVTQRIYAIVKGIEQN